jgi:hypothetical protein
MICSMHHHDNCSYIVLSLGIKVGREVIKLAGNKISKLLGIKNQISKFTITYTGLFFLVKNIFIIKNKSDKNTLVRPFRGLRANAIFNKIVLVGIVKNKNKLVLQRLYYDKRLKQKQTFFHK